MKKRLEKNTLSKIQTEDVFLVQWSILIHGSEETFAECNIDSFCASAPVGTIHCLWTVLTVLGDILRVSTYTKDRGDARYVFDVLK